MGNMENREFDIKHAIKIWNNSLMVNIKLNERKCTDLGRFYSGNYDILLYRKTKGIIYTNFSTHSKKALENVPKCFFLNLS